MGQVSPSRRAAFDILRHLERGVSHSDDLLRGKALSALSPPDRHLATALVLGVLRWQIDLDHRLRPLLKRPNAKLNSEVLVALRLAAFQILQLDRIPPRAAIDESVELTKQSGHRFASGMVNAVLRKLATQAENGPVATSTEAPQLRAYPQWMLDRWMAFFGAEKTCAICMHGQSQAAVALRLLSQNVESELSGAGIELAPGALLAQARIVVSGDVTATDAFQNGRIRIQDEGSQLVAEIAGQGSDILDCCAAPGGKALILAERNPEARIVAWESSPQRLESLRRRLQPLANRLECLLADATALNVESSYDLVLADVPCSGTGTLGRNPEIRHRLRPEEFARQAERQIAILNSALRAACPGATVVYSTCSLEPEENEQVIMRALQQYPNVIVVPLAQRFEEMRAASIVTSSSAGKLDASLTPEGYLRLFPGVLGTDGFFVASLQKTA